jgi:mannose-6-phosphate isomerase class I
MKIRSEFNRKPYVPVKGKENECVTGWKEIAAIILAAAEKKRPGKRKVIVVEVYQGVYYERLLADMEKILNPDMLVNTLALFHDEGYIRDLTQPDVTDDRIFGYMTRLKMNDLLDPAKVQSARDQVAERGDSLVVIFGHGASLVWDDSDVLIYADMARWEIQMRMRADSVNNLGIHNPGESIEQQYKRGFFVDWRICDRLKKETMEHWDFVLDTNDHEQPKLATGEAVREGLRRAASRPFSVVPFFDPGPWGGQWMKENFDLDHEVENFAWCFNCIPEENSLLLGFGDTRFEIPSINLVFYQPVQLLGDPVHARFGDEFPIRFDFLDTMAGGNLSLQVHPLTEYIQETFGMHYTQDESYYLMDAEEDGSVYLGLKEGIDQEKMVNELRIAEREGTSFEPEQYVEKWPAKKHDHFLIPAGTIHCSGRNGMVLEISATPYIFTFKLYDWGRLNLDGKPRPINLDHGIKNIQWDRTTEWTRKNLINRVVKIGEGEGWREESTGLHEREFIETRRHWFTGRVEHHTHGGVNVLTLVEGDEIVVESPGGTFDPFVIHYAETFIVPAAVGGFTIRPNEASPVKEYATIKAFVRTNS